MCGRTSLLNAVTNRCCIALYIYRCELQWRIAIGSHRDSAYWREGAACTLIGRGDGAVMLG